jgi:hypothetical protein
MQSIQPKNLSDNEILRHIYIMGFDKTSPDWVEVLVERMAALIDKQEDLYHEGFEDGFQQGVEHVRTDIT